MGSGSRLVPKEPGAKWYKKPCDSCGQPFNGPAGLECHKTGRHEEAIRQEFKNRA